MRFEVRGRMGNGRREVNAMEAPWMFGWLRGESVGFERAVGDEGFYPPRSIYALWTVK